MDQLIVILVVGALALGKWLFENSGRFQGDEPESPSNPTQPRLPTARTLRPDPGEESEEEKMRRFMEALGLPPESAPPPVRRQPAAKPAMKQQPQEPVTPPRKEPRRLAQPARPKIAPPLETGGPIPTLPKTASVAETAPSMEVTSIPTMTFAQPEQAAQGAQAVEKAASSARQSSVPTQQKQVSTAQATLMEQLRNPAGLRNAIILREILGTPKGLQSVQTPTIFSPL